MSGSDFALPQLAAAIDQRFALDVQSVDSLRRVARSAPDQALTAVSRQFEALFMGMLLKSMRDATPDSGLLGGQTTKMYQSLLDQQLAQHLSGRGLKLADTLLAQLRRSLPSSTGNGEASTAAADAAAAHIDAAHVASATQAASAMNVTAPAPGAAGRGSSGQEAPGAPNGAALRDDAAVAAPVYMPRARAMPLRGLLPQPDVASGASETAVATGPAPVSGVQARVREFAARVGQAARDAAAATGIPEKLILAQAALESAWGRREVRGPEGTPTYNLFGVKADRSWHGPVAEATTTEVIDGVARKVRARFRAYSSYQEAFADYSKFVAGNPRYGAVRDQPDVAGAANALQRAGYATDPDYAGKLLRVMKRLFD